jgi:hypothetical protein
MSLYKYFVPERLDVVRNTKIRFSQHTALNDPFEMKPHFEGLTSDLVLTQFFNASWQAVGEDALTAIDRFIPDILKDEHYKSTIESDVIKNDFLEFLSTDGRYAKAKPYQAILNERKFMLNVEPI